MGKSRGRVQLAGVWEVNIIEVFPTMRFFGKKPRYAKIPVNPLSTTVADIFLGGAINRTRNTVGQNTGLDIFQLGIMNPFGRKQETEADYLGLIFSSLSGYDIRESVKLWQRMSEKNKGKEPPVFLSTHPSSKKRIENLNNWINEVIIEYPPIKV